MVGGSSEQGVYIAWEESRVEEDMVVVHPGALSDYSIGSPNGFSGFNWRVVMHSWHFYELRTKS